MIDSKDLRLLNLVLHDGVVCEVIEVGFEWLKLNNGHLNTPVEEVEPVKLTDHWLERFGFKINMQGFNWNAAIGENIIGDFELSLRYTKASGWIFNSIATKIEYVHQLQNLYNSLTGKELELTKQ